MNTVEMDFEFLAWLKRTAGVSLEDLDPPNVSPDNREEFLKREAARYQEDKEKQGD